MHDLLADLKLFSRELVKFLTKVFHLQFLKFEAGKGFFVGAMYKQRGRMAKRLMHSSIAGLAAAGIMIAPYVAKEFPGRSIDPWNITSAPVVLSSSTANPDTNTTVTDQREGVIDYTVQSGDTVSGVAEKFNISVDTIRWQNNLASRDSIKEGQTLQILPVSGIAHKVQKGDTIGLIAKKYGLDSAQPIVDFPFNTFVNDETFELAVGQIIIVPDGEMPDVSGNTQIARPKQITPDAGTVVASGSFVWPTQGVITQRFYWYHPGIDIANPGAPNVLAADSGTVIAAGWDPTGYGNKIMIDHHNGYVTLYGHLQKFYVVVGQNVARGNAIGQMGSTGRSTGTHLHFEIHQGGAHLNPFSFLK